MILFETDSPRVVVLALLLAGALCVVLGALAALRVRAPQWRTLQMPCSALRSAIRTGTRAMRRVRSALP